MIRTNDLHSGLDIHNTKQLTIVYSYYNKSAKPLFTNKYIIALYYHTAL